MPVTTCSRDVPNVMEFEVEGDTQLQEDMSRRAKLQKRVYHMEIEEKSARLVERLVAAKEKQLELKVRIAILEENRAVREERRLALEEKRIALKEGRIAFKERRDAWQLSYAQRLILLKERRANKR